MDCKFSILTKSHEQLQIQLAKDKDEASASASIDISYATNPYCDHASLIEENTKLKALVEKGTTTCFQGDKDNVGQEGIGLAPKPKKKNKNNVIVW